MKNGEQKEYSEEKEEKEVRFSLDFEINKTDNLSSSINLNNTNNKNDSSISLKDRAKSAKPFLLSRHCPKLRPVKSDKNPTYLNLWADRKSYKSNLMNKSNINIVAEEDYEKNFNSGDEQYTYNKFYLNNDIILSSSDDNEVNENKTKETTKENSISDICIKMGKNKKFSNIKKIRKKVLHIKNKMTIKNYIDDTGVINKSSFHNYFKKNYGYILNKNNNNINLNNESFDYELDINKRSKSIYLKGSKRIKPILGFLQMNESSNNINNTLSSCELSEI